MYAEFHTRWSRNMGTTDKKSIYALAWSTNVPEWIFKKPQASWHLFVKNARTQLHENNLTDCLVAHTRSYACGLMDEHCLHIGCSFLLHNECLTSWRMTEKPVTGIGAESRREVTNLHPGVLPAQTEHHSNLWMTDKGKSWSVSAFWRKTVLSQCEKRNLCA